MESYKPYVPQDLDELTDLIGSMVLGSPNFVDTSGYFPDRTIESEYFALSEALKVVRADLGEERYTKLVAMMDRTKAFFTSPVDEDSDEVWVGRNLLLEMLELVDEAIRSQG
ncbi:hypothetical protein Q9Q95_19645 [Sphingomonas sp. DG1-23]|jgi:hypothetical protein|uniref:hypothetical protein n=1 Tax=Sphingomonas sp. DG1-23 TaxID=3068316 RepID=UPI00273DF1AE|nr:hypothetical protein [Sphingomonas sp. DG1-23]MDP5281148.1 hypothetical protein [Sphingomonas sp. DG1-23]